MSSRPITRLSSGGARRCRRGVFSHRSALRRGWWSVVLLGGMGFAALASGSVPVELFHRRGAEQPRGKLTALPFFHSLIAAQAQTASLSGTMVDADGAVIRGATVTICNRDRTLTRELTTDADGGFTFLLLPPDTYLLRAGAGGFTPIEISDLLLAVNDRHLILIRMQVGGIGASVNIDATAKLARAQTGVASLATEASTIIDHDLLANLPLNGRSLLSLVALAPGVVLTKATIDEQGQFSANGGRANANNFTIDGVSANAGVTLGASLGQAGAGALPALTATGSTQALVSVEALREVKIQTSVYAAEFGRMPGAQVALTTRAGTRDWHGAAFEYFRHDALDANDWFANQAGLPKAQLRQHDFGGALGGPVALSGLGAATKPIDDGRERTFFFVAYEALRLRQPLFGSQFVPTRDARAQGSPTIKAILNAYPLPNGAELGNGLAEFSASYSDPTRLDAFSLRLDHQINSKQTVFARLSLAPSQTKERTGALSRMLVTQFNHRALTLGATQTITPRLSNELRLNVTAARGASVNRLDDLGGAQRPDERLLAPDFASSQDSLISIYVLGLEPLALGRASDNRQRQFNLVDQVAWSSGAHAVKFGVDLRRLAPANAPSRYEQALNFSGVGGAAGFPAPTGSLLSERASSVQIISRDAVRLAFTNFSAYAQDGWRITPRLLLSYGLRWELNPAPATPDGFYTLTDFAELGATTLARRDGRLWATTWGNFAPRLGVAYQLNARRAWATTLRAGAGLFYDLGASNSAAVASSFPYVRSRSWFDLAGVALPLAAARVAPVPFTAYPPYDSLEAFDRELRLPHTRQWSLALEQALGAQQTLSLTYVGAAGRSLLRREALSGFNPNFGSPLFLTRNRATSDYHALQVQWQRRLARGWQWLTSYTWSHALDLASNDSAPLAPAERLDPQRDRGASDFDVRHQSSSALSIELPTIKRGWMGTKLLRGWAVDAIWRVRSATPVDVTYARDLGFGFFNARPDLLAGAVVYVADVDAPGGRRINPGSFAQPRESRQGTLGRNALRGFPFWQIDLALRRQFDLARGARLQLRAEGFNLLNHPNFGDPRAALKQASFGAASFLLNRGLGAGGASGGLNPVYQVGGPRSVQLAIRLTF